MAATTAAQTAHAASRPRSGLDRVYVVAAVPSPSTGTVTITLNKAAGTASAPHTAIVAWFIVN